MNKLPRLNSVTKCDKCGWTVNLQYKFKYQYYEMKDHVDGDTLMITEYIKRTCPRCGYFWKEDIIDTNDSKH